MKIIKYEHACLKITQNTDSIIIDPGVFSDTLPLDSADSIAVVVTHIHPDHIDPKKIQTILENNPNCQFFSTPEIATAHPDLPVVAVKAGDSKQVGDFTLEFFGDKHEVLAKTDNVGVLVNNKLYYPGDSYTLPNKPVEILAAPASAPWLRMPEAVKFVDDIQPKIYFPTHNALLSEIGESIQYGWFERLVTSDNSKFQIIKTNTSVEV